MPAQTRIIHYYVCLGAAGGKECEVIINALCPTKVKTPMCETMEYVQFINDLTGKDFKSVEEMYNGVPFLDVEDISSMVY